MVVPIWYSPWQTSIFLIEQQTLCRFAPSIKIECSHFVWNTFSNGQTYGSLNSGRPRNVIKGGQELKQEEGVSARSMRAQPKGANIGMGFRARKLWGSAWLQVYSPAFLTLLFTLNIS